MIIGLPKEIKNHEYRVGLTPASVRELCKHGHRVLVQQNAALEIGFDDAAYVSAGASIVDDAAAVFAQAEMIRQGQGHWQGTADPYSGLGWSFGLRHRPDGQGC